MSTEQNKAIVHRFYEDAINQGNLSLMDELFASDYQHHDPAFPLEWQQGGLAIYKQVNETFVSTFVPFHATVDDLFAEGDRVVSRWTFSGKHEKEFQGIPPMGKQVKIENIFIHRIANGKIAEAWVSYDALGLLQQLGAFPSAR